MSNFRIYKPRVDKEGKIAGAASQVEMRIRKDGNFDEVLMFWKATTQKTKEEGDTNATFNWANDKKGEPGEEVNIKLGDSDVGELLAVLNGRYISKVKVGSPGGKGIYHENSKGNSSLSLEYKSSNDETKYDSNYSVRFSSKVGDKLLVITHTLTLGEAEVIKLMLENYVTVKYGLK